MSRVISHGSNGILAGAREFMRAKAHFPNVLYKAKMTKSSLKINIRCLKKIWPQFLVCQKKTPSTYQAQRMAKN